MKKTLTLLCLICLTGCSVPSSKQTIELSCENGLVMFKWYRAEVLDENTNIKYPKNLRREGFYVDDNGKYLKCIEENK